MLTFLTDPLIYGVRMVEIRHAYHRLLYRLIPCCVREPSHLPFNRRSTVRMNGASGRGGGGGGGGGGGVGGVSTVTTQDVYAWAVRGNQIAILSATVNCLLAMKHKL